MLRNLSGISIYPIIIVNNDLLLEKINLSDISENSDRELCLFYIKFEFSNQW